MDTYFKYQGDWNDEGHEIAGEEVFWTLNNRDLESGPLSEGTEGDSSPLGIVRFLCRD